LFLTSYLTLCLLIFNRRIMLQVVKALSHFLTLRRQGTRITTKDKTLHLGRIIIPIPRHGTPNKLTTVDDGWNSQLDDGCGSGSSDLELNVGRYWCWIVYGWVYRWVYGWVYRWVYNSVVGYTVVVYSWMVAGYMDGYTAGYAVYNWVYNWKVYTSKFGHRLPCRFSLREIMSKN
jgi:hypothetical protein